MNEEPRWWEKSVEYMFVLGAYEQNLFDIAAPLSGAHERKMADAVFGDAEKLVLIEFKRNAAACNTEFSLFPAGFEKARESLRDFGDRHHFLVFATVGGNSLSRPKLQARTYFGDTPIQDAMTCLGDGLPPERFRDYLDSLFKLKSEDGRTTGGPLSRSAFASVMAVTGKRVGGTMSLIEYAPTLFLDRTPELAPTRRPTGPTRATRGFGR